MNRYSLWGLLITVLVYSPLFSIIESISLDKKGSKKVIIIGDVIHEPFEKSSSSLAELERRDNEAFFSFLKQIAGLKNLKIMFVGSEAMHADNSLPRGDRFIELLGQFAWTNKMAHGNIAFHFGDLTPDKLRLLESMYTIASTYLNPLFQFRGDKMFADLKKKHGGCTFAQLFRFVDEFIDQAQQLELNGQSAAAAFMQQRIKDILLLKKKGMANFKDHTVDYFDDCIAFLKDHDLPQLLKQLEWIYPLTRTITMTGYIINMENLLKNSDTIIIVTDNNQACRLRNFLKLAAYDTVYQKGLLSVLAENPRDFQGSRFKQSDLVWLFNEMAITLYNPTQMTKKSESGNLLKDRCSICKKEGEMKKCSACSNQNYCSVECQKKDWPKHKLVCKAPEKKS